MQSKIINPANGKNFNSSLLDEEQHTRDVLSTMTEEARKEAEKQGMNKNILCTRQPKLVRAAFEHSMEGLSNSRIRKIAPAFQIQHNFFCIIMAEQQIELNKRHDRMGEAQSRMFKFDRMPWWKKAFHSFSKGGE